MGVVVSLYNQLSHTYDEPAHVAAGLEWWMYHRYTLEPMHPPLARLMAASLYYWVNSTEYLQGLIGDNKRMFPIGWALFKVPETEYFRTLFLTRLGVLPFYLVSCVVTYLWARKLFGIKAACWALGIYVVIPCVIGNAALAATDMPAAAMILLALYATVNWLEKPSIFTSLLAGGAIGLMLCTKLSTLIQFPTAVFFILVCWQWTQMKTAVLQSRHFLYALLILAMMSFTILAIHFFEVDTIITALKQAWRKNAYGHAIWLFEPLHDVGVWYYFPVLLLFKSPLPFVLLVVASLVILKKRYQSYPQTISALFPLMAMFGVLVISAFSDINIGVRHVLVVYPLLAIGVGYVLSMWWEQGKKKLCILLVSVQCFGFVSAYPNLFAYFNALAMGHPEIISLGPDLDWNQEVILLNEMIKNYDIKRLYVCNFYKREAHAFYILQTQVKGCQKQKEKVKGWLVVSRASTVQDESFAWLDGVEPVEEIGASYKLYYFK
jgi:4-amino-4-deoxy-L-arabinose transferase-like glycosyltransferase